MQQRRLLETRPVYALLVILGLLVAILALLQLPVSIFLESTTPSIPFYATRIAENGLELSPRIHAESQGFTAVQKGDILTHLNGKKTDSAMVVNGEFRTFIRSFRIGDTLRLRLERAGSHLREQIVLTQSISGSRGEVINAVYVVGVNVAPLIIITIAFLVLVKRPRDRQSGLFFLASAAFSIHLLMTTVISPFMPWWAVLGSHLIYVGEMFFILFLALLLHFLSIFPQENVFPGRPFRRVLTLYTPYLAAAVAYLLAVYVFDVTSFPTSLFIGIVAVYIACPFAGLFILARAKHAAASPLNHRLLRTLYRGMMVFAVGITVLLVHRGLVHFADFRFEFDLQLQLIATAAITLSLPLSFAYAILRFGFMNIDVIFRRTTLQAIMAGVVAILFLVIYFSLELAFEEFDRFEVLLMALTMSGVLVLLLTTVRERMLRFIERRIFRNEYETSQKLRVFSRSMLNILEREELMHALVVRLPEILQLGSASVIAFDENGEQWMLAGDVLPGETMSGLLQNAAFKGYLGDGDVVDLNSLPYSEHHPSLNVFFPISNGSERRVGVMLGKRKDGRTLTGEEVTQLVNVADHASLGWKNAMISDQMREKERMQKEVEIAHGIQSAMLPATVPQVPGFDMAAFSQPAREVGGDFYDFITLDDGKFGIVVGDVSDKGVSAAMVMASAISTIRFAAEMEASPRHILQSANRRLFTDTFRQMFVAVCCGVIDPGGKVLTFTNAGLPKPLLYRGGDSYLIDWSENGTHYPLGMVEETQFHEQSIDLMRGDVLLLYTDGVIESSNATDEEFGVRRLRDLMRQCWNDEPRDILSRIHDEVHAFRGSAELFDDITVMVLKVL